MTRAIFCTEVEFWESFGGKVISEAFESPSDSFLEAGGKRSADRAFVNSREDIIHDEIKINFELFGVFVGQHVSSSS
jgi:hypothetical protein